MTWSAATAGAPIAALAEAAAVRSAIREVDGRPVVWFEVSGGPRHGAIGELARRAISASLTTAANLALPVVGVLDTSGADVNEGVSALDAWGRIARGLTAVSGVVPVLFVLDGACVSGPALLLGLADVVVMTERSFAYLSGPDAVRDFTGVEVEREELGGAGAHAVSSGVAACVVPDLPRALEVVEEMLSYLPNHNLDDAPVHPSRDPVERRCDRAATLVPDLASAPYDVRDVVADVVDTDSLFELKARYAPNVVTALARLGGRSIGVVANQPLQRAGTLDIEASRKAARFVSWCDTFNLPIVTFVDTPGFEPGRDLEWRGMIRHGAQLVHAYCAATVPRVCVVLRKAYGGAYIVMDSRGIGNDVCVAWPSAEIAVMGGAGAVQVLHGRRLANLDDPERTREESALVEEYESAFLNPYRAAERGLVDAVIDPADTRRVVAQAIDALVLKRVGIASRKHSNTPL